MQNNPEWLSGLNEDERREVEIVLARKRARESDLVDLNRQLRRYRDRATKRLSRMVGERG